MKAVTLGNSRRLCADQAQHRRGAGRQRPDRIEPVAPDPDAGKNTLLRWHPVVERDAIIGIAETGAEPLG